MDLAVHQQALLEVLDRGAFFHGDGALLLNRIYGHAGEVDLVLIPAFTHELDTLFLRNIAAVAAIVVVGGGRVALSQRMWQRHLREAEDSVQVSDLSLHLVIDPEDLVVQIVSCNSGIVDLSEGVQVIYFKLGL